MNEQRLVELEQIARLYGSPNCWTGTTGYLAGIILELVYELRKENGTCRTITTTHHT